jgi:hypothetical protein
MIEETTENPNAQGGAAMSLWLILHHHRHGVDTHIVESEGEPSAEDIEAGLLHHGYEPDDTEDSSSDEWWEVTPANPVPLAAFVGEAIEA